LQKRTVSILIFLLVYELDVTAVYTSQACSYWSKSPDKLECLDPNGTGVGVSSSIDVEKVEGRRLLETAGTATPANPPTP